MANASTGRETILFNIPGAGPWQIDLLSPIIVDNVNDAGMVIDATTQPGFVFGDANNMITLDGGSSSITSLDITEPGTSVFGLYIRNFSQDGLSAAAGSTGFVLGAPGMGNVLSGNGRHGVDVNGAVNALIQGNRIGTSADGLLPNGNGSYGIRIQNAGGTQVGGNSTVGEGNLISGNGLSGINVRFADNVTIYGNWIGTDATGNIAIGNSGGILINENADNAIIGGTGPGQSNVVSGCTSTAAIRSTTGGAPPNNGLTIENNIVGLNTSGNAALPNVNVGIDVTSAGGGTAPNHIIRGNTIAATSNPFEIDGLNGNILIEGNRIGTDINGNSGAAFDNAGVGMRIARSNGIDNTSQRIQIIDNIIVGSSSHGIEFVNAGADIFNTIMQRNRIGVDAFGVAAGNGGAGFRTEDGYNMEIGGVGNENIFAHNTAAGILFNNAAVEPIGSVIGVNSYYCNGTVGIDYTLSPTVTSPTITSLSAADISGTSAASNGGVVHIYEIDPICADNQGAIYVGQAIVSGGLWTFTGAVNTSSTFVATVTDLTNGISEFSASFFLNKPFITTWVPTDTDITIPTNPSFAGSYDFSYTLTNISGVGGDASSSGETSTVIISGLTPGDTYRLEISGDFPSIYFNNNTAISSELISIEQWGDIAWQSMFRAFSSCSNLQLNATDQPDFTNTVDLSFMFLNASTVDADISDWDVSTITNMSGMFNGATNYNNGGQPMDWANTGLVQNMSFMFTLAPSFDQDVSDWDVSSVTTMRSMFADATGFNNAGQPLDWANTSMLGTTQFMFFNATSFDQSLGTWDISNVTNMSNMLDNTAMSVANYDATLIGWESLPSLQNGVNLGASGLEYCAGESARAALIAANSWIISGDSKSCPTSLNLITLSPTKNSINVSRNSSIVFNFDNNVDGTTANNTNIVVRGEHTGLIQGIYSGAGTSTITFDPTVDFKPGEVIYVTISQGLLSTIGASLPGSINFQFTAASASGPATPDFFYSSSSRVLPATTVDPRLIKVLDIDGDGDLDVGMVSSGDDKVSWYENDGTQSFTEHVIYSSADFAIGFDAADLDDDGDIDFMVASEIDNQFAWFRNDGSENFTRIPIATGTSSNARLIQAHDVDGDGDLDLVTGSRVAPSLSWHENNGSETFTEHIIPNTATDILDIKVIDIDGDGDLDIGASYFTDEVLGWYENDGAQNFAEHIFATAIGTLSSLDVNDLDQDGDLDFVVADFGGSNIYWYQNDGSQSFSQTTISASSSNRIRIHDVDGDSDMDVLITGNQLAWMENDGANSFAEHEIEVAGGIHWALLADIDMDDDLDIVASRAGSTDKLAWYENTLLLSVVSVTPQANSIAAAIGSDIVISFNQNLSSATVNNSNIVVTGEQSGFIQGAFSGGGTSTVTFNPTNSFKSGEIVSITLSGNLMSEGNEPLDFSQSYKFLASNASGPETPNFFLDDPVNVLSTTIDGFQVHAADIDGDGDIDIAAVGTSDDKVVWFQNNGAGSFTEFSITSTGMQPRDIFASDFDLDGDVDLLVGFNDSDEIAWFENNGSQTFIQNTVGVASAVEAVMPIDVDGDGDLDVVSANEGAGEVAWYENDGAMSFAPHSLTTSLSSPRGAYAADVDSDGDIDVLSADLFNDEVIWFENDGSQNFSPHTIAGVPSGPWAVFAIDFDLDGDMDLMSSSEFADEVAWYENDGSQNFTIRSVANTLDGVRSFSVKDIDNDGDLDVASASDNDNKIAWLENDGSFAFTEHVVTINALQARGISLADLDDDGDLDIISASEGDDKVAWYENTLLCPNPPTADANVDVLVCPSSAVQLSGTIGGSASEATWTTSGTGSFDDNTLLDAIYTPSAGDETNGSITLTLSVAATSVCPQVQDQMTVNIAQPITAASPDIVANIQQAFIVDVVGASIINNGDDITVTITQDATQGTTTINADNTIFYTADAGAVGSDSFAYEICNQCGLCSVGVVAITIAAAPNAGQVIVRNGISPNGDGKNDYFDIQNIQFLEPINTVTIYNRWGDKVFEMDNYDPDDANRRFEGKQNDGKELPSGVYFYKVEFVSGRSSLNGYLTLKK